jgi:hypothetical protein
LVSSVMIISTLGLLLISCLLHAFTRDRCADAVGLRRLAG